MMTDLLEKAFEEASRILPQDEQDSLAKWLLEEFAGEAKWQAAFAHPKSHRLLEKLAAGAIEEDRAGRTDELDPDAL